MAGAIAAAEARPRAGRTARLAAPPEWLWPLSILLQVASAAALTAYTYFFMDDWLFIAQARRIPLSIDYLRLGLYEHFSPISRLLDKLLAHNSTASFALAHSLQLLMYAAAIVAFAFVVRTILGNRWSAFALTVLYGQSLFLVRLLNWWTATANILPATIFGLLMIGAYLRWQPGRSRTWAIVSLACFSVALLDYENAILLPFYILVVRLLVLEDDVRPRAWLAVLRREGIMWAGYVVLVLAALINFYAKYYHPVVHHASLVRLLHFLVVAMFATFIPALFGISRAGSALGREPVVVVACVLAALGLTAYLVYRRPQAWRCVLAFVLIALATMLPLGIARVGSKGVHAVATELYYQQSLQFMLLILVALAVRGSARRAPPRWLAAGRARLQAPAAWGSLLVAGAATYGALLATSVHATAGAPDGSHRYVRNIQSSVESAIDRTHREPVLFNAQVPTYIAVKGEYSSYDVILPMMSSSVRFNTVTSPMYVVSPTGVLEPVSFHAIAAGLLTRATVLHSAAPATPAVLRNGAVCAPAGAGRVTLRIPLQRPVRLRVRGLDQFPRALRLFLRMPARATVTVATHGRIEQPDKVFPSAFGRGTSGQYVPLDVNGRALAIDVRLTGGACVNSLAVGSFAPAARP